MELGFMFDVQNEVITSFGTDVIRRKIYISNKATEESIHF